MSILTVSKNSNGLLANPDWSICHARRKAGITPTDKARAIRFEKNPKWFVLK